MPEFSAPLRVTWDLPADPAVAAAHWRELVACRVLFVELALEPHARTGLSGISDGLSVPGVPRLTLAAGTSEANAAMERLSSTSIAGMDLLLLPPHTSDPTPGLVAAFRSVTWAVWSTGEGLAAFPAALAAARAAGGGTLAVLNPPAPAEPLTPGQRRTATSEWRRNGTPEVQLRVHDLFLAQELGLEPFREYAGCQAGDGLAHLSADGVVTACRTLPVELGTLVPGGLREIWSGAARQELRRRLAVSPAACAGCAVGGRCRGGCRGLVAWGGVADLAARDPSCPGPLSRAVEGTR